MRPLRQSFIPSYPTTGVFVMALGNCLSRKSCALCLSPSRSEILVSPPGRCFVSLSPEKPTVSLLLPGDGLGPGLYPTAEPVVSESSFPLWSRLVVTEMCCLRSDPWEMKCLRPVSAR